MKKLLSVFIIGLMVCTIVAQESKKTFSLENTVQRNEFRAESVFGLKSMNDGQHYCSTVKGNILVYSYKTGKIVDSLVRGSELIPEGDETPIHFRSYSFSQDESKILIPTETESIYRWSSKSNYYIWDIHKRILTNQSNGHGSATR